MILIDRKNKGRSSSTKYILEEVDGKELTKWGFLKSYKDKKNSCITLDYVKKL